MEKTAIIITGPTASGKSALAVDIARRLGTGIISADSRQVYRDIPVSTAAPTADQLSAVPHYLVGMLGLEESYSAARFEADALRILDRIFRENDFAVVCGGSMMYIDALCNGLDPLPDVPADLRERVHDEWRRYGNAAMRLRLLGLDPDWYSKVDLLNMKRVVHAVELSLAAGRPYSSLLSGRRTERPFRILKYCLCPDRATLFDRIDRRTGEMVADGLEEEARRVIDRRQLNSLNTVGLKEMFAYIDGDMDFRTAVERVKKNTRVYAKKQLTWFRRDPDVIFKESADEIKKDLGLL